MTMPAAPYQVFAVKYAHLQRNAGENFIFRDAHDGPMPLDFYVWAIVGDGRTFVVDVGFDRAGARRRERELIRLPSEGLRLIDIDPAAVEHVIVSHLHYDHCGNLSDFPKARLYLQDREMAYATGRYMRHGRLRMAYDVEYVTDVVRAVYDERVQFIDGEQEIAPGISVHHVGGHTDGLQVVRVWTERGWLVLAVDAAHFYANMQIPNPFPIVFSGGDMLEGFDTLRALADDESLIIPGHDPQVLERFPAAAPSLHGSVARLDQGPTD